MVSRLKSILPRWVLHQLREIKANIIDLRVKILTKQKFNYERFSGKFNYNRFTGKIKVTIFGSCRQDSISRRFSVTPIRDGLTYPHYTKEIIQAINFVKSEGAISPKNLGVFRNIQLGLPIRQISDLHKHFRETDVFVVEIASRISYEYQGDFFHHFAYDQPIGANGLRIEGVKIVTRVQSDDEIREDMATIRSLLEPKPVIFVTHFCTYSDGSRGQLRDLVIEEARAIGSTSFDPSQMLLNYPAEKLVEDEKVISHFSEFGHEILSGRYQLIILQEYLNGLEANPNFQLNQVLDSTPSRVQKLHVQGLGDSGLGLAYIYRYAIANGRVPGVNAKNYFASKFLIIDEEKVAVNLEDIQTVFHEDPEKQLENSSNVFTNKRFPGLWDATMRDFLLSKLFTPTKEFGLILEQTKADLGLFEPYEVIHIRFSDSVFKTTSVNNIEFTSFLEKFLIEMSKEFIGSENYLVLSDSQYFNELAKKKGFKIREGVIAHSGFSELTDNETLGILVDFFLLAHSKTIHQISSYSWGSGFSQLAASVYNIPISRNDLLTEKLKTFFRDGLRSL